MLKTSRSLDAVLATTGTVGRSYGIVIGLHSGGNGRASPPLTASSPVIDKHLDIKLANSHAFCVLGPSDKLWIALPLPLPNDPKLIGANFYNQYFVYDPPAHAFDLVRTNGGAATIGEQ